MKTFYPDETAYLIANFMNQSTRESLAFINSRRNQKEQLCYSTFRWMIRRYFGFKHEQKAKEWTNFETNYLLKNYKTKGNIEIANFLNSRTKKSRNFTKKHVEKKMKLLKLKRNEKTLYNIKENHKRRGAYLGRTSHRPIGQRYIRRQGKHLYWFIVTDKSKIEFLHRIIWIEAFGQIPENHKLYFKDGNTSNCKLENLECKIAGGTNYKQRKLNSFAQKAIPLLPEEDKEYFVRIF